MNPYQQAIHSVCSVLEPYDSDKMYPVYGFGAKIKDPATGKPTAVQHCFPVYGGGLEVHGVAGIQQVTLALRCLAGVCQLHCCRGFNESFEQRCINCDISYYTCSCVVCLLQAYKDCLGHVMLSGPTLFGPIIKATHDMVAAQNFR